MKSHPLNPLEAAKYLNITLAELTALHCSGVGPTYQLIGYNVWFHVPSLDSWSVAKQKQT